MKSYASLPEIHKKHLYVVSLTSHLPMRHEPASLHNSRGRHAGVTKSSWHSHDSCQKWNQEGLRLDVPIFSTKQRFPLCDRWSCSAWVQWCLLWDPLFLLVDTKFVIFLAFVFISPPLLSYILLSCASLVYQIEMAIETLQKSEGLSSQRSSLLNSHVSCFLPMLALALI